MKRNIIRKKFKAISQAPKKVKTKVEKFKLRGKTSVNNKAKTKKVKKTLRKNKPQKIDKPKVSFFSHFAFDKLKKPDSPLLILFIVFVVSGLFTVMDTSLVFAKRDFNNVFHFLTLQILWVIIGTICFAGAYFLDYKIIRKFVLLLYIATLILLVATLFTHEINGAKSWLSLGGLTLQPSEIAKLTFVLYISGNLSQKKTWVTTKQFILEDFLPFAILLFLVVAFVLLGKDLGTSIIIVTVALLIYLFKSSTKNEYIAFTGMFIFVILGGAVMILSQGYRSDRVDVWLNLVSKGQVVDPSGKGYQMEQILLALGSGGLKGVGLGESLQKYDLVETTAANDSVIAIIAEEFGFLGVVFVLMLFLFYLYRGLKIASNVTDRYGQIVAIGIVSWIGMQAFLHVSSNVGLTPLTGVPMPFLSYGGSSLVACMTATGILLNISRNAKKGN